MRIRRLQADERGNQADGVSEDHGTHTIDMRVGSGRKRRRWWGVDGNRTEKR
jgi:hypothetical protein